MSTSASPGWMPGTNRSQIYGGNAHKATVSKIVLHTTEGSSWPGYNSGKEAPHFTVHRGSFSSSNVRQHIPTTQSSKALEHPSGTPETNNAGVIQIEFIGSCDKSYASKYGLFFTENATDADLAGLAKVVAWIAEAHGIPLTATGLSWPTSNAAYSSAPQRFTNSEWSKYRGVCGHTHVPNNVHWDPGAFPVSRLLKLAAGASPAPPPKPTTAPAFPLPRTSEHLCYYGAAGGPIESVSGKGPNSLVPDDVIQTNGRWHSLGLAKWQQRLINRGWNELTSAGGADGRYGDVTAKVTKQFQGVVGVAQDGKVGPATWEAAWTEAVT